MGSRLIPRTTAASRRGTGRHLVLRPSRPGFIVSPLSRSRLLVVAATPPPFEGFSALPPPSGGIPALGTDGLSGSLSSALQAQVESLEAAVSSLRSSLADAGGGLIASPPLAFSAADASASVDKLLADLAAAAERLVGMVSSGTADLLSSPPSWGGGIDLSAAALPAQLAALEQQLETLASDQWPALTLDTALVGAGFLSATFIASAGAARVKKLVPPTVEAPKELPYRHGPRTALSLSRLPALPALQFAPDTAPTTLHGPPPRIA